MILRWSLRARRDLVEIGRPLAEKEPEAARRRLEGLRKRVCAAARQPFSGRRVPELGREEIRELWPTRTYRVVYRVLEREIHVLTVFRSYRLPGREVVFDAEF